MTRSYENDAADFIATADCRKLDSLIFGDVRRQPSNTYSWQVQLNPTAYAQFASWQLGRDVERPDGTIRIFVRRKRDAEKLCAFIRIVLSALTGIAADHGVECR